MVAQEFEPMHHVVYPGLSSENFELIIINFGLDEIALTDYINKNHPKLSKYDGPLIDDIKLHLYLENLSFD